MKVVFLIAALVAGSGFARADYTGQVSAIKHFGNGGVAIDLDGRFPHEKMELYVFPSDVPKFANTWPKVGSVVTATGLIKPYHGQPEIVLHDAIQLAVKAP